MKLGPVLYGTSLYRLHLDGSRAVLTTDGRAVWRGHVGMLPRVREVPVWVVEQFVSHLGMREARS